MNIRNYSASLMSGRRIFGKKHRQPIRTHQKKNRVIPHLEALEDRYCPSTFSILDSFSGGSFGTPTLNSGGTADVDSMDNTSLGINVHNHFSTPRVSDSGSDSNLRTGVVDAGFADPLQLANMRSLTLTA